MTTRTNAASEQARVDMLIKEMVQRKRLEESAMKLTADRLHALAQAAEPRAQGAELSRLVSNPTVEDAEWSDAGRDLKHYPRGWWLAWLTGAAMLLLIAAGAAVIIIAFLLGPLY